ncbi:MAG: Bax inhibitor-1/YccA family protein [Chloroflexi bacterium]|nr:Bax inhibitor-1/YccA family protein [Chloroflexota bacterium]
MSFPTSPTAPSTVRADPAIAAALLSQAFLWMFAGLLLTAGVAFVVQSNQQVMASVANLWLPIFFGQLAIVWAIGLGIRRMNATLALGLFFVYAATLGFTVAVIVSLYTGESVTAAFLSASAMFGAAGLYGVVTKRSLTGLGGTLMIGIVGLIVASLINVFFASGTLSWIISVIGVVIFTALTAYDTQRIASGSLVAQTGSVEKAAVMGALSLYLDFINLFLFLLRLFGSRR